MSARERLRRAWQWLRRASGDDAYERYRAHQCREHAPAAPLTRAQFYAREQERKWNGVNRCC
jgi:uncharacterized short protein YbdD (DUF466 family)